MKIAILFTLVFLFSCKKETVKPCKSIIGDYKCLFYVNQFESDTIQMNSDELTITNDSILQWGVKSKIQSNELLIYFNENYTEKSIFSLSNDTLKINFSNGRRMFLQKQ